MQSAWQSVGKPNGIQNRNETLQEWEMKKIKEHKLNIREKTRIRSKSKDQKGKKTNHAMLVEAGPKSMKFTQT